MKGRHKSVSSSTYIFIGIAIILLASMYILQLSLEPTKPVPKKDQTIKVELKRKSNKDTSKSIDIDLR